jgi:hypothetical protein
MIVGLALVDTDLFRLLSRGGFLRALIEELREPLESVLSEYGSKLWESGPQLPSPSSAEKLGLLRKRSQGGHTLLRVRCVRSPSRGTAAV